MRRMLFAFLLVFVSSIAAASEKSIVQTSVNVPITKWSDDFAERYEYASPDVSFQVENGQLKQSASVSLIKMNGVTQTPRILVMVA